jgi:hypothetical protein
MAYFIAGHGAADLQPFIVPDGCYIVVKMDTCKYATKKNDYDPGFERVVKLDEHVLLDPSHHVQELRKQLGFSFHIYGPGDEAPGFYYYLLGLYVSRADATKEVTSRFLSHKQGSGLMDLMEYRASTEHQVVRDILHNLLADIDDFGRKEDMIEYLSMQFYYSVMPTMHEMKEYLTEKWKDSKDVDLEDMLKDIDKHYPQIRITQEELCKTHKGVYYHSVCRPPGKNIPASNTINLTKNRSFMERRMKEIKQRATTERNYHTTRNISNLQRATRKNLENQLSNATRTANFWKNAAMKGTRRDKKQLYRNSLKKRNTLKKLINQQTEPPGNTTLWGGSRKRRT